FYVHVPVRSLLSSPDTCTFLFNHLAAAEIYTLSLHDALPIFPGGPPAGPSRLGADEPSERDRLRPAGRPGDRRVPSAGDDGAGGRGLGAARGDAAAPARLLSRPRWSRRAARPADVPAPLPHGARPRPGPGGRRMGACGGRRRRRMTAYDAA